MLTQKMRPKMCVFQILCLNFKRSTSKEMPNFVHLVLWNWYSFPFVKLRFASKDSGNGYQFNEHNAHGAQMFSYFLKCS